MSDASQRRSTAKRVFLVIALLVGFAIASLIGARMGMESLYRGIESNSSTGLSAVAFQPMLQKSSPDYVPHSVARTAELVARSSSYEQSVQDLHRAVAAHHGFL